MPKLLPTGKFSLGSIKSKTKRKGKKGWLPHFSDVKIKLPTLKIKKWI